METIKQQFPLVEAILLTPAEGVNGNIAICTNTSAPGQVINDIPESLRKDISVLGSLIVCRDGGERLIINSLVHPTLKYLILFSEESTTFAPSTNFLQLVMEGFDKTRTGNYVSGGVGASYHYPNINEKILGIFREEIIIIPAFMHKQEKSGEIIQNYLSWLQPKVSDEIYKILLEINSKDKIYYDSLGKLIKVLSSTQTPPKKQINLDPLDFQHLQPPKIELEDTTIRYPVPFRVSRQEKNIRLDIEIENKSYFLISSDPFTISYSLMKHLGQDKVFLSPTEQLLLGSELGRVSTEILNDITFEPFVLKNNLTGETNLPLEYSMSLVMDKKYYYKITTRGSRISTMCMSFDVCESVFELLSYELPAMIERISEENRFENYEMDILHRIDIGTQLGRAAIAAKLGYSFIQDFSLIFKINKDTLPSLIVDGDTFLDVHKQLLRSIYTKGITEEHGDSWKGLARTASVLAIYRNSQKALESMPALYRQGDQNPQEVRDKYKAELLRLDHDGSYSYGQRTRVHFGFDQLQRSCEILKKDPTRATIIQRFDPVEDMTIYIDPDTEKRKFTHDPCLTHDIFFIQDNKLHSFHIARAHNTVNAYPENIFGLFDAYVTTVRDQLKFEAGDMYMLSNRANILLLTEEQRTKKILSEPSKPTSERKNESGPHLLGENSKKPVSPGGVAYFFDDMKETYESAHPTLDRIRNYRGINTLDKAINYLKEKGGVHNNPILTEYYAGESNPQDDQLVFFQANVFGKKIYATAVWINRSIQNLEKDKELVNYLGTLYSQNLSVDVGSISIYYVGYKNN